MTIWFVLWLVLSAALLYFFGWTIYILYRQKRAWKNYASKRNLRYMPGKALAAPEMSGILHDYSLSFFTGEHMLPDARGMRKMTGIEVKLSSQMPFEGSVASGGMVPIVRQLDLKEEFLPSYADWNKNWIAAASSRNALEDYLTPARLEVLGKLMKIPNAWVIFVFRGDVTLLRIDTPDPLDALDQIDKLVKIMTDTARALELKQGEEAKLKTSMAQPPRKVAQVSVAKPAVTLELEDEQKPTSDG